MRPNICGAVMAFGFMRQMTCLFPNSVNAAAKQSMIAVFPIDNNLLWVFENAGFH